MAHIYDVGTRAWQPESTQGWVPSQVVEKLVDGDNVKLTFMLDTGEVCVYFLPFIPSDISPRLDTDHMYRRHW